MRIFSKKDLRFKILEYFDDLELSTSEIVANKWLSAENSDLGSIRRALIELVDSDFLSFTGMEKRDAVEWFKTNMDTTTHGPQTDDDKDKKSSKRLIMAVGKYSIVPEIRIYTTIKGIVFIQEYKRFKLDTLVKILLIMISGAVGYFLKYLAC